MRVDTYQTIVREKDQGPGDLGDSCADTARIAVLTLFPLLDLRVFRTTEGYVRHPNSPWREDDFSSDQAAPLMIGYALEYPDHWWEMKCRLSTGHTGNGRKLSPGLWALVHEKDWLLALITVLQGFLFLFPLRWSDSHHGDIKHWWQRIQWGGDEGDYLNWVSFLEYLDSVRWRKVVKFCYHIRTPETVVKKVRAYYANQPNSEWILEIYETYFSGIKRRLNV